MNDRIPRFAIPVEERAFDFVVDFVDLLDIQIARNRNMKIEVAP